MLLQRGSVGDDLWQRFQRAEKEMEEEVKDVVSEVSVIASCIVHIFQEIFADISCNLGKCLRPRLGPNHLPVRKRNDKQQHLPPTHERAARKACRGARLVG